MTRGMESAIEASVRQACKTLRLPTVGSRAKELATEAGRTNKGHLAYLDALLDAEIDDRDQRRRQRRITDAKFPRLKRLEDFNFSEAPGVPAQTIRELSTCSFIDRAENVIFLGESGTGKSHLAIALGICACMQSRRVRFTTVASLVNELIEARDDRSLSRRLGQRFVSVLSPLYSNASDCLDSGKSKVDAITLVTDCVKFHQLPIIKGAQTSVEFPHAIATSPTQREVARRMADALCSKATSDSCTATAGARDMKAVENP